MRVSKLSSDFDSKHRARADRLFHVTSHAIDDLLIFGSVADKKQFIECLRRHLTPEILCDRKNRPYRKLNEVVEVLAFAVLDNHFHLILRQLVPNGVDRFMRSILTGYAKYFNNKYGREGPIFRGSFDARWIQDGRHAKRAIAYAHLNHEVRMLEYPYTSHADYLGRRDSDWLSVNTGLKIFGGSSAYEQYMAENGPKILAEKAARRAAHPAASPRGSILRGRGDHIPS